MTSIDLGALDGANGFRLDGVAIGDDSGRSVSAVGDVNGDGFGDVIVGARLADTPGDNSAGSSYVVFGGASGFAAALELSSLDGDDGFRIDGIDANDRSGTSVAGGGDFNGDGVADILIGAPAAEASPALTQTGQSYILFGRLGGFAAVETLGTLDATEGVRVDGAAGGDESGGSIANVGDFNGDGLADVIIGAFKADPNSAANSGSAFVLFGSSLNTTGIVNLSNTDGDNGVRIDGFDPGDFAGFSVDAAGDVNGDGLDDVIIGAYKAAPNGRIGGGESYVVFGASTNLSPTIDLSNLDGANGFRIQGVDSGDYSGFSVAGAGDVNGDGFADVIVGAYSANVGGDNRAGESYVVFGKASGFAAAIDLGALDGSDGFRLDGVDRDDLSGIAVSRAGDFNSDGFEDLIVGAYVADPQGRSGAGESYIVFGGTGLGPVIDLAALDGADGVQVDGAAAGDYSGRSVHAAGDVNGDGFADVIVGAPGASPAGGNDAGESFVVFGFDTGNATHVGNAGGNAIIGNGQNNFLILGAGDDTFNGGGGDDTMFGGQGRDQGSMGGGNDRAFGGEGNDVITGGTGDDILFGNEGADRLTMGFGNDQVAGGPGDDLIFERADQLGAGDSIFGGLGFRDTLFVQSTGVLDLTALDAFVGMEQVRVAGNQIITSVDLDLNWIGRAGNEVYGLGDGRDIVRSGGGGDVVRGNGGDDILNGQGGDDRIDGGTGTDRLIGSVGADIFEFAPGDGRDIIFDFSDGTDQIDLIGYGFTDFATDVDPSIRTLNGRATIELQFGDRIVLVGVAEGDLDAGDFILT